MQCEIYNDHGDLVRRYGWRDGFNFARVPVLLITPTPEIAAALETERRDAIATRDELLAAQKACAAERDYDGAKALKPFAQEQMRRYRAACLVLPWFTAAAPGDCPVVPPEAWSVDLEFELDAVWRIVEAA